jgi:hypothetical protein
MRKLCFIIAVLGFSSTVLAQAADLKEKERTLPSDQYLQMQATEDEDKILAGLDAGPAEESGEADYD